MKADIPALEPARLTRRSRRLLFGTVSGRIGVVLAVGVVGLAAMGPAIAPHSATAVVGTPFQPPSTTSPLGTDEIGRDVLSRVLVGGWSLLVFAGAATLLAYIVGGTIGLVAGFNRSLLDPTLMRTVDVILAFPPILFLLLLAAGMGPGVLGLIIGISVVQIPGVARIVRTATLETSVRGYVEAAVARGERTIRILRREILPNITGPLSADVGPRFTVSVLLVAALNYLGLGRQPPAADWAVMVSENRTALTIPPWTVSLSVLVPAVLIAVLAISVNLIADASVSTSQRRDFPENS